MRLLGTSKTKASKYNSTVGLVASIGMLLFAFIAFDFSTMPMFGKLFMILWVFVVCAQIYQSYRNSIFSNKSLHHEVTDHRLKMSGVNPANASSSSNAAQAQTNHAMRLRQIEQLYREGLLTTEEYELKRQDVLDEDWGK